MAADTTVGKKKAKNAYPIELTFYLLSMRRTERPQLILELQLALRYLLFSSVTGNIQDLI